MANQEDGETPEDRQQIVALLDLCLEFCLANPRTYCLVDAAGRAHSLRPDAFIPPELGERMISRLTEKKEMSDDYLALFADSSAGRPAHLNLAHSPVTERGLQHVVSPSLLELDLSHCSRVGSRLLQVLEPCRHSLHSLVLTQNQPAMAPYAVDLVEGGAAPAPAPFPFTQLRVLELGGTEVSPSCLDRLLSPLQRLVSLNLSGVRRKPHDRHRTQFWGQLACLRHTLQSLVLHQCDLSVAAFKTICQLKQLRHLDVSSSTRMCQMLRRRQGHTILSRFMADLPHLTSLDVSDTILAHQVGRGSPQDSDSEENCDPQEEEQSSSDCDLSIGMDGDFSTKCSTTCNGGHQYVRSVVKGLQRLRKPLKFLGLLKTPVQASDEDLPALKCTGVETEEQALTAIEHYSRLDRLGYVDAAFRGLFDIVNGHSHSVTAQHVRAMQVVVSVMQKLQYDRSIIQLSEACLYQLTKSYTGPPLPTTLKRSIISQLLEVIEDFDHDSQLQQFACFVLCNFSIPGDLQFVYQRAAADILRLTQLDRPSQVQRIAIVLCNAIVCQVEGDDKLLMGKLGIIHNMVEIIQEKLEQKVCDDVLEAAWSTMWNVTDETEDNCQAFLDQGGLDLFTQCYRTFPDKPELLRNMMGLLGNVAEVKKLRPRMIQCIQIFSDLLGSQSDGIEVSYNAAGIVSHILSDGEAAWTVTLPRRQDVLQGILDATGRWNLHQERNINYRSFVPVLRLLTCFHTPQAIHWAVWALTNLCTVYPDKYCKLLKKEGGLEALAQVMREGQVLAATKALAQSTLSLVHQCQDTGGEGGGGLGAQDDDG